MTAGDGKQSGDIVMIVVFVLFYDNIYNHEKTIILALLFLPILICMIVNVNHQPVGVPFNTPEISVSKSSTMANRC